MAVAGWPEVPAPAVGRRARQSRCKPSAALFRKRNISKNLRETGSAACTEGANVT
jgi:hypothetical protein